MVRPIVENFKQSKFINSGTIMATGDKQEPMSTKKLALRDHLPSETRNTIPKSPGTSPLSKDTSKLSGLKRQQPSCLSSPSRPQPLGTNGHLVYVRRKLDTEPRKMNSSNPVVSLIKKSSSDCRNEPNLQSEIAQKAEVSLPPSKTLDVSAGGSTPSISIAKPNNELPLPSSNASRVPTGIPDAIHVQPEPMPSTNNKVSTGIPDAVPVQAEPLPSSNCSRVPTGISDAVPVHSETLPSTNGSKVSTGSPDAVPVQPEPSSSSNCSRIPTGISDAVPVQTEPLPSSNVSRVPSVLPNAVTVQPEPLPSSNCPGVSTGIPDAVPVRPKPLPSSNVSRVPTGIPDAVPVQPEPSSSSNCSRISSGISDAVPVQSEPLPSSNVSHVPSVLPNAVTVQPEPLPSSNCPRVSTGIPDAVPVRPKPLPSSNGSRVPTGIPDAVPVQPEPFPSNLSKVLTGIPVAVPVQPELQRPRDYWKERFGRLQMFLKSCDESSQEEYIQRLRSLSAAGRSRHAYELEKRAIQLTLEEGKELTRMTALNVFGKALPDQNGSVATQIHTPRR